MAQHVGIIAMQIHFPKSYVEQSQLEQFNQAGKGKYTIGLGQDRLSFAYEFEDVNSMSLTVVDRLMRNYNIDPARVGRLQIGTETLLDKSKSTKTVLMTLFKDNHDIQGTVQSYSGATSVNACYGATNALFNAINWVRSDYWDGRLAIVVACDIAVYEKGPARPTGGAGAVAMLIGPNARLIVDPIRSTFVDHQYDFYKPNPGSEYPIVDGSVSINCYLTALEECYKGMQKKYQAQLNKQFSAMEFDFMCFHSPFYKMVQKAFNKLTELQKLPDRSESHVKEIFNKKVHPTMYLSKTLGNIYTGSLYTGLLSLMLQPNIAGKRVLMFSYGSGLMSSMFSIRIRDDLQDMRRVIDFESRLTRRVSVTPQEFDHILQEKENRYGKILGRIKVLPEMLEDGTFYLTEVDDKMRRKYQQTKLPETKGIAKKDISSTTAMERIENLDQQIASDDHFSGLYKLTVAKRVEKLLQKIPNIDVSLLESGGLTMPKADIMIENVVGKVSLPLAIAPNFVINKKSYIVPMCIEEPSVVAACSSIAKMIAPYSFATSSTPNVMIGQVHLPECEPSEVHLLLNNKRKIINHLNSCIQQLVKRGGGVENLTIRKINGKHSVAEITISVCEAMGANIVNTLCEKLKSEITQYGVKCGIAVLSNYCTERMAMSTFEIPLKQLEWKGHDGIEVAQRVLEAYEFARSDRHRATTHNKGILNGIDGVCVATGQDWRAVESAAHSHAGQSGKYQPLTHYEIIQRKGVQYFKGSLELPISVGTVGGALEKNPIYKTCLQILGNPDSKEFSEVLVSVGLAQNFAALRALAIEGIQKGHMMLHSRSTAVKAGVPSHLVDEACRYMSKQGKYDEMTAKRFLLQQLPKPKL